METPQGIMGLPVHGTTLALIWLSELRKGSIGDSVSLSNGELCRGVQLISPVAWCLSLEACQTQWLTRTLDVAEGFPVNSLPLPV